MYTLLFIIGLAVGSFLNVVALRYDPARGIFHWKSIGGRSRCPECKTTLRSYDLIPLLSFMLLRAKCRYCRHPLSFRYPVVELASGFIFLLPLYFANRFGLPHLIAAGEPLVWYYALVAVWTAALLVFLLIALIDLQLFLIPDVLNWLLAGLGVLRVAVLSFYDKFDFTFGTFLGSYAALFGLRGNIYMNATFGAFFGAAVFGIIIAATRGKGMGLGDMKLAAALGLLFGWPDIALALVLAFFAGALWSIERMALGKNTIHDAIPFGPFIVLGAALTIFFGNDLLRTYFNFFNIA
ncbi:MAG: prepilin peptidase [Candidatus Harrisonbacteria bacterium]|nr:prepilin peptidase [Candidatus Harrisonbacteria bacterium]